MLASLRGLLCAANDRLGAVRALSDAPSGDALPRQSSPYGKDYEAPPPAPREVAGAGVVVMGGGGGRSGPALGGAMPSR